jgi:hypothetical protein
MNARNPQQTAEVAIDIELDHPIYGWIPFTASPDDPHGADLYVQAFDGAFGPVAEYVASPEPVPVPVQPTVDGAQTL